MIKSAKEILFRCSSLGHIMTEGKKGEVIGETCKTHLIDVYLAAVLGRREEKSNKYLRKGHAREEDAITLVARVLKEPFSKNDRRLNNSYISGELDLFQGPEIIRAERTIDTKCSWSAHTFYRAQYKPLDKGYKWQGVGYMGLSGAKVHTVAHCLVNGTAQEIDKEKKRLGWEIDAIDYTITEEYMVKAQQIERNHIFDLSAFRKENPDYILESDPRDWDYDIPFEQRIYLNSFERSEADIAAVYRQVQNCRDWINENLFKLNPVEIREAREELEGRVDLAG